MNPSPRLALFGALVVTLTAATSAPQAFAGNEEGTIEQRTPVIGPGGGGPGGGGGFPPYNNSPFAPITPLDIDNPGGSAAYDFGEAPDFGPLCAPSGLGFFPTRANSPSATGGRSGPRHLQVSDRINVSLGRSITYEIANAAPQCDWLSTGCDLGDDGLLLLCLDDECAAGIMISRGSCGLGVGASFGAAPIAGTPDAFFIARTHTGDKYIGSNYLNIIADINADGTMVDFPESWSLRDAPIELRLSHSIIHRSESFPVITFDAESADDWNVNPFWTRLMVSEERIAAFTSIWDGSGRAAPYQWGETEDFLVRTQQGRWLCRLPTASVQTTLHAVITLDPEDTEVLSGVEFVIDSAGQAAGRVRLYREATLQPGQPMPIEVTSLTVRGNIPELGGTVNIRERSERLSFGVVDVYQTSAGSFVDGDLILDLSLAIDLLDIPRTLDTRNAFVRVEAPGISAVPPAGLPLLPRDDAAPLELIDRATLQTAGWMRVISVEFTQVTSGGCPGDANNDGSVNFDDLTAVLSNWGNPGADGDASGDCVVDFIDLTSVLANWNTVCG